MLQEQELITQHNIDMNNKLCYFNDVGTASSNLWGGARGKSLFQRRLSDIS